MIPSEAKVICIQPVLKSIRNIKQMIVEKKISSEVLYERKL